LKREIRSYVLRQGRTTPSQQRALDELLPRFGIAFSNSFLDTKQIFGRTAPLILEIGSGMGETTAEIAQQNPALDFIAIEDIGRVLNPLIVHSQALGAIVQGLGGTFLEHLRYDEEGQLLTASFADYLLPSATDFPNIRGHFMELALAPGNPLGAKGAGEGGIVAVAAAVSNAVSAALSSFRVQIRELPLSPPRIWQLVQDSQAKSH